MYHDAPNDNLFYALVIDNKSVEVTSPLVRALDYAMRWAKIEKKQVRVCQRGKTWAWVSVDRIKFRDSEYSNSVSV